MRRCKAAVKSDHFFVFNLTKKYDGYERFFSMFLTASVTVFESISTTSGVGDTMTSFRVLNGPNWL